MTEQMELAVIDAQNAVQIFTGGGLNAVLDGIEAKVRAIPLDPSTVVGREEIRSVAYQVARTKVALDQEGKKLTEGWREATKKVNEERKRSTERLEALAEEVRKPLTDFENKENVRVKAHEEALAEISGLHTMIAAYPDMSLDLLSEHRIDLSRLHADRNWEEFAYRAKSAREEAEKYIGQRLDARKRYEVEQEELARLRKEEAERIQRERDERLQKEAAEKQRLESERKAAAEAEAERKRVAAESERVRAENERKQREAEAAIAKAEADKVAAIAKAKVEKEAAEKRAREAAQRERDKIESERKAKEVAEEKRRADDAHRLKIRAEILEDLNKAATPVDAIMDGRVRHVRVIY